MKFRVKVIIPVMILLLVSISLLSIFLLFNTGTLFKNNLLKEASGNLTNVKNIVLNQEEAVKVTTETISKTGIPLANSVARILDKDKSLLSLEGMSNLAKSLNIEEICVVNKQGIIVSSNIANYINFDFNSSEQTKPFLDILSGKIDSLAQMPMKRGSDGKLFQFIGVRNAEGNVVQVGFSPEAIVSIQNTLNIESLLENMKLSSEGIAFTVSKDGTIVYHPSKELVGKNVSELTGKKDFIKGDAGNLEYVKDDRSMLYTYQKLDDNTYIVIDQNLDALNQFNKQLLKISLWVIIIIAVISAGVIYLIVTKVAIKPINKLVDGIKRLEEGDFTVEIDHKSKDEIGVLTSSLNVTTSGIRNVIYKIKELSSQLLENNIEIKNYSRSVANSSEEISVAVEEIATGSTAQANSTTDTLELTNVLDDKIKLGTVELNDVIRCSEDMNEKSVKGKESIHVLNRKISETTEVSDEVYNNINELLSKSNLIGNIVDTIKSIADQTNLLALNAAIESARAGEHGRGFAVVAGQVKKLAEESESSSSEIQSIVSEIISLINRTTKSVEESKTAMDEAKGSINEANVAFEGLDISVSDVLKSVDLLSVNNNEIAKAKDELLTSIENIASIAHENAACAEEVSSSTEEQTTSVNKTSELIDNLNKMNEDLSDLISNFKV